MNELDLIANNLANLSTAGFRPTRTFRAVYDGYANRAAPPEGAANRGVALAGQYTAPGPGPMLQTKRPLDVALSEGDLLAVETPGGMVDPFNECTSEIADRRLEDKDEWLLISLIYRDKSLL